MEEIWKDIPLYEGCYQVSNYGRIKSVERKSFNGHIFFIKKERILKSNKTKNGYLSVCLCKFSVERRFYIHRLVAKAFVKIENPKDIQVNHKDGNKENNFFENLEWVTPTENIRHSFSVLNRKDSYETRIKKSISKRGEKNFFYGKNPWQFRKKKKKHR